jgi:Ca2+-binding RTX toxin-like protein
MKKAILSAAAAFAMLAAPAAHGEEPTWNLLLSGGPEDNSIEVALSADGRNYEIDSTEPLEVGGTICSHPEEDPDRLWCTAATVSGFEVNSGSGDDTVVIDPKVTVPVTLRGGAGSDRLGGGGGGDRLVGGAGPDVLLGRGGDDSIFGGAARDRILGGAGNDQLRGGPGDDLIRGGPGKDAISGDAGRNAIFPRRG